jgi:hypothetical protein
MSRIIPQITALALVSCFVLCQPALLAASTLSPTSQKTQRQPTASNVNVSGARTSLTIDAAQPTSKPNESKSDAVSAERTIKKGSLRFRSGKSSRKAYLKSSNGLAKLRNHRAVLGAADDCDACHNQCLLTSAACIAISIITACPACGLVCLAYQAACQTICNGTTACKNKDLPVVNDN